MSRNLTDHQTTLLNILRAARKNSDTARRIREREISRRLAEAKLEAQRQWDRIENDIRVEVNDEVTRHAAAVDEALIAAYNAGVPVRRIALDGFGNRHDGNVHVMLKALRADGRVGNAVGFQINADGEDHRTVEFPQAAVIEEMLEEHTTIKEPEITLLDSGLVLVPESAPGAGDGITVAAATLTLDSRDPYFHSIRDNARKGTLHRQATTATIYIHPGTGKLVAHESAENGDLIWDHPVARFVKDHNEQVRAEFEAVLDSAPAPFAN